MKNTADDAPAALRAPTDPRIRETVRQIESDERAWPTSRNLADTAGLSEYHFNRLFHDQIGETVGDYIRRHKLDIAAMRLNWTNDTILQVALSVGYKSQAAFTRAFRAKFGVTPGRYQQPVQSWRMAPEGDTALRVIRVRDIESFSCVTKRYIGSYTDVGQHWQHFLAEISTLMSVPQNSFYAGLTRDDPSVTAWDQIRYDCSVVLSAGTAPDWSKLEAHGFIPVQTYAGPYACLHHSGDYMRVGASYALLMDRWMTSQARYYGMPDEPAIELYRDPRLFSKPEQLEFEIMMALY